MNQEPQAPQPPTQTRQEQLTEFAKKFAQKYPQMVGSEQFSQMYPRML